MQGGQIEFDHATPQALASNDGGPGPCGGAGWGSYIQILTVFLGNIPMDSKGAPVVVWWAQMRARSRYATRARERWLPDGQRIY
jgi:hypothetical protein